MTKKKGGGEGVLTNHILLIRTGQEIQILPLNIAYYSKIGKSGIKKFLNQDIIFVLMQARHHDKKVKNWLCFLFHLVMPINYFNQSLLDIIMPDHQTMEPYSGTNSQKVWDCQEMC